MYESEEILELANSPHLIRYMKDQNHAHVTMAAYEYFECPGWRFKEKKRLLEELEALVMYTHKEAKRTMTIPDGSARW